MAKKRTDLAAPTVIDPAAFCFVAGVYFGAKPGEDMDAMLGEWMAEKDPTGNAGWYSKRGVVRERFPALDPNGNFAQKGTCDHCGAWFEWGSVYAHTSGKFIVVGNICAEKTLEVPDRLTLDARRMQSRLAAARDAARKAARARAEAATLGIEWLYDAGPHGNKTLDDIARKGLQYGGLTGRQVELVKRIHDGTKAEWEIKRDAERARRAAEEAAALPVPVTDSRIDVQGEVLTTREQEGYMPGQTVLKMLVRDGRGFKLWGSVPRDLMGAKGGLRGKQVAFAAKVQRSPEDDKFGFFSRPTKARVIDSRKPAGPGESDAVSVPAPAAEPVDGVIERRSGLGANALGQ